MRITLVIITILLMGCTPKMSVLVWDDLGGGQFHVVGLKNQEQFSDVVTLPITTKVGDIVKIKQPDDQKN